RFAGDLCQWETEYFTAFATASREVDVEPVLEFYKYLAAEIRSAPPHTLYFSIGHGSGWHKLTVGLLLEKRLSGERFAELRRSLKLADRHTDFAYPKSRKLVMGGENRADSPFGWVRLDFRPL
ncbi:MAG TPA: hypothetical protein VIS78_03275, partial [Blastocatellia bacterium]